MIGIIGLGKMGTAIAGRLYKNGLEVIAKDKKETSVAGVQAAKDYCELAGCEALLFCVKPLDLRAAAAEIKSAIEKRGKHPLLISIAAGKSLSWLEAEFGNERIIRAMPNLAATAGKSFTCFSVNSQVSTADVKLAESVFSAFGSCLQVEEALLDAVTAISGSGPAYFLYFARALAKAGVSAGLDKELADLLARRTLIGVSAIAEDAPSTFDELIASIATPGGTTEAALGVFEQDGMEKIISNAVHAAKERCEALAQK